MADPDLERVVDREALDLYLQHQYVPSPWTILEGVAKLPPASVLTWDGGEPHIERYWSPSYEPKDTRPHEELVEEGLSLIREAVRLRLRSDVPVGVFLSGGMDSSVVTALMAEQSVEPVRTFSIGFEDQSYDELGYARAVAERYGTVHSEEIVSLDAIELLPHLAEHYDEPFADSSAVPTFRVVAARRPTPQGRPDRRRRRRDLRRLLALPGQRDLRDARPGADAPAHRRGPSRPGRHPSRSDRSPARRGGCASPKACSGTPRTSGTSPR